MQCYTAVMTLQRQHMEKLIHRLRQDHPQLTFSASSSMYWSPDSNEIRYSDKTGATALAGLLHEVGHARLGHRGYRRDFELLKKEVAAWEEALKLGKQYGVFISLDHIQDCLDTYREWIYKRSACPTCSLAGLQEAETRFRCINCSHSWMVTAARFCRPYRRSQ